MSGLIVVGIVAIWILVLVPMWLNRHDADNPSRSVDSFSTAMRVLSRRTPAHGDRRYVVMPRRDSWGITVDNYPQATTARRAPFLHRPVPAGAGRARLVARRRRVATVVFTLAAVLALSAALDFTSWWLELAVDLLLAGYVVHLRNEALRDRELRRRRAARAAHAAAARTAPSAPQEPRRESAHPEPVGEAVDDLLGVAAVSASGTDHGSRWEPVPVPLPTYVSKPVVARPAASAPRADVESGTIDLTRPGAWSHAQAAAVAAGVDTGVDVRHLLLDETGSGRIAASPGAPRPQARSIEIDDDELDVILERRRAVGD